MCDQVDTDDRQRHLPKQVGAIVGDSGIAEVVAIRKSLVGKMSLVALDEASKVLDN